MGSAAEKWRVRAETYTIILDDEGVEAAGKYLDQFLPKINKLLDALWIVHLEHEEDRQAARERKRLLIAKRRALLNAVDSSKRDAP